MKNDRVRAILSHFCPVFFVFPEKTNRVNYGVNRANNGVIVQRLKLPIPTVDCFDFFKYNIY